MYQAPKISYADKTKFYNELKQEASGLLESPWLMNTANLSALIHQHLPEINWVGFYFLKNDELQLGPFQGLPACTRIKLGKGVCGTAAQKKEIIIVEDVDKFPGHIACDAASRSEIVLPIIKNGKVLGVLDIDSPAVSRFTPEDANGLTQVLEVLIEKTDFAGL
jgi:GAF domain-containing protein